MMSERQGSMLAILLFLTLASMAAFAQDDGTVVKDFEQRVGNYAALKSKQGLPQKSTSSANKLAEQKEQAVEKIREVSPVAHQGDIFTPQIATYFKKQIQATLHGPGGKQVQASLRHAEPLPDVRLEVNAKYPENLPLQSTPPTLLQKLPQLPKGLQYRVVGSALILYDEASNLIVDFIPDAIA
jgi:hypothetical protein